MKKALISIFLAFVLLSSNAGIAEAASLTPSQISAIVGLLRSFGADEGAIARVNAVLTGTSVPTDPEKPVITYCPTIKNTLYRGSSDSWTGGEVSMLQRFLRQLYPDLPVTGYFGVLTEAAVERFQSQYGISPVGIVGPETSKKIASLCGPVGYPIDPPAQPLRDSSRISDIKQIQLALELFFDANGSYPFTLENLSSTFIPRVPRDPDGTSYAYKGLPKNCSTETAPCTGYHLGASLEISSNPALAYDADYNSSTAGGFDGYDLLGCHVPNVGVRSGRYCYDVTQVPPGPPPPSPAPSFTAQPNTAVRGETYTFTGKVTGGAPNVKVKLYVRRPDGSMSSAFDSPFTEGITDSQGNFNSSISFLVNNTVQLGTWVSWVTVAGVPSNKQYHEVVEAMATNRGYLQIEPSGLNLYVGGTGELKAYYQPPMPPCPSGAFCAQVMPARQLITTQWSSSNPSVAAVTNLAPTGLVRGISQGSADIKAIYTVPGTGVVLTERVTVYVKNVSSITVLSPNGGEQFQLGSTQPITWSVGSFGRTYRISVVDKNGFGQGDVATVTGTAADKQVYYWNVGQVKVASDRGDLRQTLSAGEYKILISEVETGNSDYSNAPFSIVSGTALSIPHISYITPTSVTVGGIVSVYGSNLYGAPFSIDGNYGTLPNYQDPSGTFFSFIVPSNMSVGTHTLRVEQIATGALGNSATFTVVALPQASSITVLSPNGGEVLQKGTPVTIKWNYDGNYGERSVRIDLVDANPSYGSTPNPVLLIANYIPINSNNYGPTNSGSYTWTIPTTVPANTYYKIRMAISGTEGYGDLSDSTFQIVNNVALATPVFTKLSVPTNTLTNGTQVLYRFRATTISSQDASISSLQFPISLTGVAPISLSNISLYGYSDSGFSVQAYSANPVGQQYGSIGSTVVVFSQGDFPLGVPLAIPAGTSRYFEVRGYVNTGSAAPVSVTTSLSGLGSETLTKTAPTTSTNPVGYVGPVSYSAINGWACVPGLSNQLKVSISITPGNYQISNITANVPRTEAGFLQNSGCTDINHGFAVNPSLNFPSLPAGTYSVSATAQHPTSGAVVALTPLSGQTTFTVGAAVEPAPSLSSVTPNTVTALQTTTFVIIGDYFQPGAIVVYSGPSSGTLSTTFYSKSELRVAVTGGLLQGTYTFKVLNPPPYGKESGTLSVQATAPTAPSGAIISMTPNPCTVAQGATRCPVTIMWSAFNAPLAGIRAKDSVSGWEGLVCAADKTLCTLDAAPGNYAVKLHLVATDPNSQILDQKSGVINPPSTLTGGATSGADLVALSISPSGPFTVGQSVTFSAVVKNAGGGAMPGSGYDADLMIDYGNDNSTCQGPGSTSSSGCNAYIGSPLSVPLIAPAATHTFSIPWTATCQIFTAPCTHLLRFRVDLPYNLMPESSESNNYITKLITVNPVGVGDASSGGDSSLAALIFSLERQIEELSHILNSLLAP